MKHKFKTGDRVRHANKEAILANRGSEWQRYENTGDRPFVGTVLESKMRDWGKSLWDDSDHFEEMVKVQFDDSKIYEIPHYLLKIEA